MPLVTCFAEPVTCISIPVIRRIFSVRPRFDGVASAAPPVAAPSRPAPHAFLGGRQTLHLHGNAAAPDALVDQLPFTRCCAAAARRDRSLRRAGCESRLR